MDTSFSRFGMALAATSLMIGVVGFAVYMDSPDTTIKPALIHRHASAVEISTTRPFSGARYREARAVVGRFVTALGNTDDAAMLAAFPTMTSREARVLNGIRTRLGEGATLAVGSDRLTSAANDQIDIDFVILARVPGERMERHLPFHATVRNLNGSWVIETLY